MGAVVINTARASLFEGQDLVVKARIVSDDGTRISEDADAATHTVQSADFYVYDLDGATPATKENSTTTIDIAGAGGTFTTVAEGYLTGGWDKDGTGYNFCHVVIDATDVTWAGGHRYRIDYAITHDGTILPSAVTEGTIKFSVYVRVKESY